ALPEAVLPRFALASEGLLHGDIGVGRLVDAEFTQPLVNGLQLLWAPKDDAVQLVHLRRSVTEPPGVLWRGQEEPEQRQLEAEGKGEKFVSVELPPPVPLVRPFDGRNARLGEPLAQEPL